MRLRRAARRHRPVRLPWSRRQALPAQQLRPPRVPPRLRRTARSHTKPPRTRDHRRRNRLARHPRRRLASRPARHQPGSSGADANTGRHRSWRPDGRLCAAPRSGDPGHPGGHSACLLASDQARPDPARLASQDLDGRKRDPRDPRRAAARPPSARDTRPVRPRIGPDAGRAQGSPPTPLGRVSARPHRYRPALASAAARRAAGTTPRDNPASSTANGTTSDPAAAADTCGQGEDDLPNSSQTTGSRHHGSRVEPVLRASDLARYQERLRGAKGTRTPDPLLAKQVLFQLSYSPVLRRSKRTCAAALSSVAPSPEEAGWRTAAGESGPVPAASRSGSSATLPST